MMTNTPRTDRLLADARTIASDLGHDYLGTEHLLLAIARDEGGVASKALNDLGVRADVDRRVLEIIRSDGYATTDELPAR